MAGRRPVPRRCFRRLCALPSRRGPHRRAGHRRGRRHAGRASCRDSARLRGGRIRDLPGPQPLGCDRRTGPPIAGERHGQPCRRGRGARGRGNAGPGAGCGGGRAGGLRNLARHHWDRTGAGRGQDRVQPSGRRRRRCARGHGCGRAYCRNRDRTPPPRPHDYGTARVGCAIRCGQRRIQRPDPAPGHQRNPPRFILHDGRAGRPVPGAARRCRRRLRAPQQRLPGFARAVAGRQTDRPDRRLGRIAERELPDRPARTRSRRARPARHGRGRALHRAGRRIRCRPRCLCFTGRGDRQCA